MEPLRWQVIAEGFRSGGVATGERGLTLFARAASGELVVFHVTAASGPLRARWAFRSRVGRTGLTDRSGGVPIAACATGPEEIQILARGQRRVGSRHARPRRMGWLRLHRYSGDWIGGLAVPMGLASAPSACQLGRGRWTYSRWAAAGALLHSQWDGKEFAEFESLGGVAREGCSDDPLAKRRVARAAARRAIAVAARVRPATCS